MPFSQYGNTSFSVEIKSSMIEDNMHKKCIYLMMATIVIIRSHQSGPTRSTLNVIGQHVGHSGLGV